MPTPIRFEVISAHGSRRTRPLPHSYRPTFARSRTRRLTIPSKGSHHAASLMVTPCRGGPPSQESTRRRLGDGIYRRPRRPVADVAGRADRFQVINEVSLHQLDLQPRTTWDSTVSPFGRVHSRSSSTAGPIPVDVKQALYARIRRKSRARPVFVATISSSNLVEVAQRRIGSFGARLKLPGYPPAPPGEHAIKRRQAFHAQSTRSRIALVIVESETNESPMPVYHLASPPPRPSLRTRRRRVARRGITKIHSSITHGAPTSFVHVVFQELPRNQRCSPTPVRPNPC